MLIRLLGAPRDSNAAGVAELHGALLGFVRQLPRGRLRRGFKAWWPDAVDLDALADASEGLVGGGAPVASAPVDLASVAEETYRHRQLMSVVHAVLGSLLAMRGPPPTGLFPLLAALLAHVAQALLREHLPGLRARGSGRV